MVGRSWCAAVSQYPHCRAQQLTAKKGQAAQRAKEAQARKREHIALKKAQEAMAEAEEKLKQAALASDSDRAALQEASFEARRRATIMAQMAERERQNRLRAESRQQMARDLSRQAARAAATAVASQMEEKLAAAQRMMEELAAKQVGCFSMPIHNACSLTCDAHTTQGDQSRELALARAQARAAQAAADQARNQAARLRIAERELKAQREETRRERENQNTQLRAHRLDIERTRRELVARRNSKRAAAQGHEHKERMPAAATLASGEVDDTDADLVDTDLLQSDDEDDVAVAAAAGVAGVAAAHLKPASSFKAVTQNASEDEYGRVLDAIAARASATHLARASDGESKGVAMPNHHKAERLELDASMSYEEAAAAAAVAAMEELDTALVGDIDTYVLVLADCWRQPAHRPDGLCVDCVQVFKVRRRRGW